MNDILFALIDECRFGDCARGWGREKAQRMFNDIVEMHNKINTKESEEIVKRAKTFYC